MTRDLKIDYKSGTKYLNDTIITVPKQKAVEIRRDNFSAAIPVGQGIVNVTDLEISNTGNAPLDLKMQSNTTKLEIFFGERQIRRTLT
ncbi:MAG: hypothetical protein ABEK04_05405 [Candidatus Nanohalobium sp.]